MKRFATALVFGLLGCPSTETLSCPDGWTPDELGRCALDWPGVGDDWDDPTPAPLPRVAQCEVDADALQDTLFDSCQSTFDGDVRLRSQQDVLDFCAQYDCATGGIDLGATEGGLGQGQGGIDDLSGLSCLKAARYLFVGNNLSLTDAELPNLQGLLGALTFGANQQLQRISLPAMRLVGGDLSIQNNGQLRTLEMPALDGVLEFFFIIDNPQLPTVQAEAIRDSVCPGNIGGAVAIAGNGGLE